jgi:hypothetical protein
VEKNDWDGAGSSWAVTLVHEAGRAAQAGWAVTARLIALVATIAAAVALILVTNR